MRASHIGRPGTQSFAALVSFSRVAKPFSVRSITHRSPGAQPMSVKITGRATGVFSNMSLRSGIGFTSLEHKAQQLIRRHVTNLRPCLKHVGRKVIKTQPGMPRAAPHWRLVDAGGEPARCHRRKHASVARPGDAEGFARGRLGCGQHPHGGQAREKANRAYGRARAHRLLRARARCSPIGTSR